ncbi:MAG: RNA-binding protein [Alphaproteobacteria bacterium]|nr:RNA-binding protein [Alphaproteobacteria bacterium]
MGRGGKTKDRDGAERKCIVTGQSGPTRGLIRFVVGPDDTIVPDLLGKLPGRGTWVSADRTALETAVKKRLFARAARGAVTVPETLIDDIEAGLVRRVVDRLAMARKAGRAVAGYEKVKSWLLMEEAAILLQASDGSERGKSKLRPPGGKGSFFDVLKASELGLAFGREHVIHAALARGGLTEAFREDALRLSGVRDTGGGDTATGKVK